MIVTGVNAMSAMGMDATLVFSKIASTAEAPDGKISHGGCRAGSKSTIV